MKKPVAISLLAALLLLTGNHLSLTHAQAPGTDLKPTFISPTPGLYVNGWPAFTVSYPKEWVERVPGFGVFGAGAAQPDLPSSIRLPWLTVGTGALLLPLDDWAKPFMPAYAASATDIKVLSDKPSRLKDGTPAREIEVEYLRKNDPKVRVNDFTLLTKKEVLWVWVQVMDDKGRIGDDLKKYVYSLTFRPGREEPVQVPPDVKAFLDMWCADAKNHDVQVLMSHFSDRFLHGGYGKAVMDRFFRNDSLSPIYRDFVSFEPTVTVFEAHGDRAYVDGFFVTKAKGDTEALKLPMMWQQIIKEQGQWKWYGNQK